MDNGGCLHNYNDGICKTCGEVAEDNSGKLEAENLENYLLRRKAMEILDALEDEIDDLASKYIKLETRIFEILKARKTPEDYIKK